MIPKSRENLVALLAPTMSNKAPSHRLLQLKTRLLRETRRSHRRRRRRTETAASRLLLRAARLHRRYRNDSPGSHRPQEIHSRILNFCRQLQFHTRSMTRKQRASGATSYQPMGYQKR